MQSAICAKRHGRNSFPWLTKRKATRLQLALICSTTPCRMMELTLGGNLSRSYDAECVIKKEV